MIIVCEKCGVKVHIEDSYLTTPTKENPMQVRLCQDCYADDELGVII